MISALNRNEALIRELDPLDHRVADAMRAVPRHLFVPPVALACPPGGSRHVIDRDADPTGWWNAVHTDIPIVTQLDDGATDIRAASGDSTSSSSAPGVVARFLEWLDPEPETRVLEVGTGTGWTAALLSHLVGAANVTSVEVDPVVAEQAAKNLSEAGFQPHLIVGDGAAGCPGRAPFDRVHVTCGIRTVPYAWVAQARPGAVLVAPYSPRFQTDFALRLVVAPGGVAHGRFPRTRLVHADAGPSPRARPAVRRDGEHAPAHHPRRPAHDRPRARGSRPRHRRGHRARRPRH